MSPAAHPVPGTPPEPEPRRVPSTVGGMVYLLVVLAGALGLGSVALGAWRRGIVTIGVALLVGAAARLVLSDRNAGMLRVRRHRWVDVLMLTLVGATMVFLALVIPDQTS